MLAALESNGRNRFKKVCIWSNERKCHKTVVHSELYHRSYIDNYFLGYWRVS